MQVIVVKEENGMLKFDKKFVTATQYSQFTRFGSSRQLKCAHFNIPIALGKQSTNLYKLI